MGYEVTTHLFSYSGEDAILKNIFNRKLQNKEKGLYVDVGAYHPFKLSNTFIFYLQGWRGINIDARPGSMELFNKYRPEDTNLEVAISDEEKELSFYFYEEDSANSFSKEFVGKINIGGPHQYVPQNEIKIKTVTLKEVLDNHLPAGQQIDFLSIDVEGLDFQVLKSNDWTKYKPSVIVIEMIGKTLKDIMDAEITKFLGEFDYSVCAKTVVWENLGSVVFVDSKYKF